MVKLVDEIGRQQFVYNIEVPFVQLLLKAADQCLVVLLCLRHESLLLDLRALQRADTLHDAT